MFSRLKKLILLLKHQLNRYPRVKYLIMKIFDNFPQLSARIRSISYSEIVAENHYKYKELDDFSSIEKKVYDELISVLYRKDKES